MVEETRTSNTLFNFNLDRIGLDCVALRRGAAWWSEKVKGRRERTGMVHSATPAWSMSRKSHAGSLPSVQEILPCDRMSDRHQRRSILGAVSWPTGFPARL